MSKAKEKKGLAALPNPQAFKKKTLKKGEKPNFDFRGKKDNKDGTVTYV